MPPRFVGEFGLGRKMRQGNRQPLFDPNNCLLDAGEPCFEADNAGFAHETCLSTFVERAMAEDRHPSSPRIRTLEALVAKLEPPRTVAAAPLLAIRPDAIRHCATMSAADQWIRDG
jgi:hypothetical protein